MSERLNFLKHQKIKLSQSKNNYLVIEKEAKEMLLSIDEILEHIEKEIFKIENVDTGENKTY